MEGNPPLFVGQFDFNPEFTLPCHTWNLTEGPCKTILLTPKATFLWIPWWVAGTPNQVPSLVLPNRLTGNWESLGTLQ